MNKKIVTRSFPHLPHFWEEEDWGMDFLEGSGLSVWEDKTHVFIEAALPGLKSEEIEVSYEKGILWIKGERESEEKTENKKYYRKAAQSFSYRIAVPGFIDEAKEPEATYQNGIMRVTFVKQLRAHPKKIAVKKGANS